MFIKNHHDAQFDIFQKSTIDIKNYVMIVYFIYQMLPNSCFMRICVNRIIVDEHASRHKSCLRSMGLSKYVLQWLFFYMLLSRHCRYELPPRDPELLQGYLAAGTSGDLERREGRSSRRSMDSCPSALFSVAAPRVGVSFGGFVFAFIFTSAFIFTFPLFLNHLNLYAVVVVDV